MGKCCNVPWCGSKCADHDDVVDCAGKSCGNARLFEPCDQCMSGTDDEIKDKVLNGEQWQ
jgi:hypothetical protein